MIIVSDTTPLISLMKVSKLDVLKSLFGKVIIPDAVYKELTDNERFSEEAELIRNCDFIEIIAVNDRLSVVSLQLKSGLDIGETEAIICAEENKADTILMDEAAGRRTAKSLGLNIMGTIGILLSAYEDSVLSAEEVREALNKLRMSNRHISENLLNVALEKLK